MNLSRPFVIAMMFCLVSCASARVEDFSENTPSVDIRDYLSGDVSAEGMFIDNSGKADPFVHVDLHGEWKGNTGTLTEHFDYSDGRKQDRLWLLTFSDDHHFTGTAADVKGTAKGEQFGNAVQMSYVLAVQTKDGNTYDMSMNDWLFKVDEKTLINRNEMRKFGYKVGEIILTFNKK